MLWRMNTLQKIFFMVAAGSTVIFIIAVNISSTKGFLLGEKWQYMFTIGKGDRVNWLAIISLFNIIISNLGYYLFADKNNE